MGLFLLLGTREEAGPDAAGLTGRDAAGYVVILCGSVLLVAWVTILGVRFELRRPERSREP